MSGRMKQYVITIQTPEEGKMAYYLTIDPVMEPADKTSRQITVYSMVNVLVELEKVLMDDARSAIELDSKRRLEALEKGRE